MRRGLRFEGDDLSLSPVPRPGPRTFEPGFLFFASGALDTLSRLRNVAFTGSLAGDAMALLVEVRTKM